MMTSDSKRAAPDTPARSSSESGGKAKDSKKKTSTIVATTAAPAANPEMRGREKLDFLLKQTELFTQFILMQGRGMKLNNKE